MPNILQVEYDAESDREFIRLCIRGWIDGYIEFNGQRIKNPRDGRGMTSTGLGALERGQVDLALECFSLALPQLLEDLGPNGPPETETTFVAMDEPHPIAGGAMGQKVTWGWSAEMKADWWVCVGLCRWVLENRHDEESFMNAGDCLYRWVAPTLDPPDVDNLSLCGYAPLFVAAHQYDRAMELFDSAPKFKPPRTPGMARTQRAMAYLLCQHYAQGKWTDEQISKAWASFFPAIVFSESQAHLSLGTNKALWIKMRYWDSAPESSRPDAAAIYANFAAEDARLTNEAYEKLMEEAKKDPRLAREIARQRRFYERVVADAKKASAGETPK